MSFTSKIYRLLAKKSYMIQIEPNKIRIIRKASSEGGKTPCDPPPGPPPTGPSVPPPCYDPQAHMPCCPQCYDCRKYGHKLPAYNVIPPFQCIPRMPSGIFRITDGEKLGPCAGKDNWYKNPEYFSFNHMSFFDLHLNLRQYRCPSQIAGRKPVTKY